MKHISSIVISGAFILLICVMFALYLPGIVKINYKMISEEISMDEYVEEMEECVSPENIPGEYSFINLNGLFERLTGRNECNEVVRLTNGMLTERENLRGEELIDRFEYTMEGYKILCDELGCKFLYVQGPAKMDSEKTLLYPGAEDYSNENADLALQAATAAGCDTLDLRPGISDTAEEVTEFFYKTDHHWNATGAFKGFQKLMEYLRDNYDASLDMSYCSEEQWDTNVIPDIFLGSRGKRVGIYFGGVDDLIYLTPKFPVEMSIAKQQEGEFIKGSFEDCCIYEKAKEKNYFEHDPYAVYFGGNKGVMRMLNENAPNKQHLLIIKDSYANPVLAYLITEFAEITVLDPRYYTYGSIGEYIAENPADLVIYEQYAGAVGNENYLLTDLQAIASRIDRETESAVLDEVQEIVVDAGDHDYYREVLNDLSCSFRSGYQYTVSFDSCKFESGDAGVFSVEIYDTASDTVIMREMLDVAHCEEEKQYQWHFTLPENITDYSTLKIALVPGVYGQNRDCCARISNFRISAAHVADDLYTLEERKEILVEPADNAYNRYECSNALEGGRTYLIEAKAIEVTAGNANQITVRLSCNTTGEILQESQWTLDDRGYRWIVSIPETIGEEDDCRVSLYAGVAGETKEIGICIKDLTISELLYPNNEIIYNEDRFEIAASDNSWNYRDIPVTIEGGEIYSLHMDRVEFVTGNAWDLQAELIDKESGETISMQSWSLDWTPEEGYNWTFKAPEGNDEYRLIIYAGSKGYTKNNGVVLVGLKFGKQIDINRSSLICSKSEINIEAKDSDYNCYTFGNFLESGYTYTLTMKEATLSDGIDKIYVRLYSDSQEMEIESKTWYFDENTYTFNWTFTVPNGVTMNEDYQLEVYAGEPGETSWESAIIKGVTLTEEFQ